VLTIDKKLRIVDPSRSASRDTLCQFDRDETGQCGPRDGVYDKNAARAQESARLLDHSIDVNHVLEDLSGAHDIDRSIGKGSVGYVGTNGDHPVIMSESERARRDVEAYVPVALTHEMRREKAGTTAEVHEDGAFALSWWHHFGPRCGDPMQHRESAPRRPPLLDKVVVLLGIVA
jgi:hypothetical protein